MLLSQLSDGLQNVTLFVRELNTTMKRTQHTNIGNEYFKEYGPDQDPNFDYFALL